MRIEMLTIVALAAGSSFASIQKLQPAGVHGEPPDETHAWAECDRNRPNPPIVVAREGQPPSDARVLVSADREKTLSSFTHYDGSNCKWDYDNGVLQISDKGTCCYLAGEYADFQLHLEWRTPKGFEKKWAGGNSGVIIHPDRRYEVQIVDSSRTGIDSPNQNPDYADGQAGAIYGQTPPIVNPCRAPGEWQMYDIVFHAAKWKKGVLVHPATISVMFNGVLVQDNWEMLERTPPPDNDRRTGKVMFQNHGYAVAFRNVWIREIPAPWANDVHGGPYTDGEKIMALREKTAAELFREMPREGTPSAQRVEQALEIVCYSRKQAYRDLVQREERRYLSALKAMDEKTLDLQSYGVRRLKKVYDELKKHKLVEEHNALAAKCEELIKARKFAGHVYWW